MGQKEVKKKKEKKERKKTGGLAFCSTDFMVITRKLPQSVFQVAGHSFKDICKALP